MSCKISASISAVDGRIPQENKDDVVLAAASAAMAGAADKAWMLLAHGGLFLVGVAGGALLIWWALEFHHANEQLWMVPVGLVLLGTPIFVWLSVFASAGSVCGNFRRVGAPTTALSLVSDPER